MNMFNKLPHFVYINNKKYFIKTDFRIFINFEKEMQGKNKKEVIFKTLKKFYPAFFKIVNDKELLEKAVDKFIWFYKCGKQDVEIKSSKKSSSNKRIFDYDFDSDLIWGAFYSQYRIDLSYQYVHWWKFRSMWVSLDEKCRFNIVRGYRSYNGEDKELIELRNENALPPSIYEQDDIKRRQEIFNSLNNITSQK